MGTLGGGGLWWRFPSCGGGGGDRQRRRRGHRRPGSSSSESIGFGREGRPLFDFPLKQATIAASLTLTGDTVAQVRDRLVSYFHGERDEENKELISVLLLNHDWLRALRMASYGFLLYGPGSFAWYKFLDQCMPKPTFLNLSTKVILNQIVLGPCVIAVIFAWNNLWLGKISQLPSKYQKDALPTLLFGFRFWIPVSILNFGVIPLSARVAFMSTCSIFWNFYLSTTMSK
ncbi:protein Mpv17 [Ananas comosus]|uniref:Protein Mpv17 n=1 Tax=Ananas comosus TaxID=4615 RepID=A0A6P5GBR6_ANACO|nr:protein Mpv17 [Ananas comosus]